MPWAVQEGFDAYYGGSINRWGLRYRAVDVWPNIMNLVSGAYVNSMWGGVDRLRQLLLAEPARCSGDLEKVVLTGYSQGAQVIHRYLSLYTETDIKAVVLIADPARTSDGDEVRVGGANHTKPGFWTRAMGESIQIPSVFTSRTISTCHDHDIVCESTFDSWVPPHSGYGGDELRCLGRWAAETVSLGAGRDGPLLRDPRVGSLGGDGLVAAGDEGPRQRRDLLRAIEKLKVAKLTRGRCS